MTSTQIPINCSTSNNLPNKTTPPPKISTKSPNESLVCEFIHSENHNRHNPVQTQHTGFVYSRGRICLLLKPNRQLKSTLACWLWLVLWLWPPEWIIKSAKELPIMRSAAPVALNFAIIILNKALRKVSEVVLQVWNRVKNSRNWNEIMPAGFYRI